MSTTPNRFSNAEEARRVFELQHAPDNLQRMKNTTAKERIERIRRIDRYLNDPTKKQLWMDALHADLRKSREEAIATELATIQVCMRHIYDELGDWMRDRPVSGPLAMLGMSSWVRHEPKGHVMVISPWNYPLQLAVNPLIHAIAAGNVVLLKPSEIAAATSGFLKTMMDELFDEREVAVVEGDVPTTTELLSLPFHHIFFTGSPKVGKIVMRAASEHLTSVTLELGGKSPVIVDETANVKDAAEKVAWGKCINAGQTCIAPDYALVVESKVEAFAAAFEKAVQQMYNRSGEGIAQSSDYCRIIDDRNYDRVKSLIDDAVQNGASLRVSGDMDASDRLIAPHLLLDVSPDMRIMDEEIFGPVLPVLPVENLDAAIEIIIQGEKPLALYIMSKSKKNIGDILRQTTSGGVGINEVMVTSINPNLPFGGVNHSGIGKSNGHYGFVEFSNERGVVKRKYLDFKMIYPPYKPALANLLGKLSRW